MMNLTITRRILFGACAALAGATGFARRIAARDQDADLLASRPLWRKTKAAFDAVLAEKAPIESRCFARRPVYPVREAFDSGNAYDAEVRRADQAFRDIQADEGLTAVEIREASALEAYRAVLDRITTLRARTIPGLSYKVEVSRASRHTNDELLRSIVEDLESSLQVVNGIRPFVHGASQDGDRPPSLRS